MPNDVRKNDERILDKLDKLTDLVAESNTQNAVIVEHIKGVDEKLIALEKADQHAAAELGSLVERVSALESWRDTAKRFGALILALIGGDGVMQWLKRGH